MGQSASREGSLCIVGTPIGNISDASPRVRMALESADVVFAEDTRNAAKLMSLLGISNDVQRLDENVMASKMGAVLDRVRSGERVCYCTDAGMPGVSDPGLRLVDAALDECLPVEVVPGPSALICAYVASGSPDPSFYFGAFLPRKGAQRLRLLRSLAGLEASLIFYESPNRLVSSLESIAEALPSRKVAVCRELTKAHEEVVRGSIGSVLQRFKEREGASRIRGEIAIVIFGPTDEERDQANAEAASSAEKRALQLAGEGASTKAIAKELAAGFKVSRNEAYQIAMGATDSHDKDGK